MNLSPCSPQGCPQAEVFGRNHTVDYHHSERGQNLPAVAS